MQALRSANAPQDVALLPMVTAKLAKEKRFTAVTYMKSLIVEARLTLYRL